MELVCRLMSLEAQALDESALYAARLTSRSSCNTDWLQVRS